MSEGKRRFSIFKRSKQPKTVGDNKVDRLIEYLQKNQRVIVQTPFSGLVGTLTKKPMFGRTIENRDMIDYYQEDPEIRRLQMIMVDRTPQNLRWAYNHDNSCSTAGYLLAQAVIGASGITIKTENDDLKQILMDYFDAINSNFIIEQGIKDNLIHTETVWWKEYNEELNIVIPRWIDYITLTPIMNEYTGSRKWIQVTAVDSRMPKNDNSGWKKYEPYIDPFHTSQFTSGLGIIDKPTRTHIFEEDTLNFHFFSSPPVMTIVDTIIWKKWMQYDAKLSGQKNATPIWDASISTPDGFDLSSDEARELNDQIANDLLNLMNFGVTAHSDAVAVQPMNQQNQGFDFVRYLEYADKQIHKAILVPFNLLESSGAELATSRTTKDMFLIVIRALRAKIIREFKKLALDQLEFIGKSVKPGEFEILFSEDDAQQQMTQAEEFNALMQLADRGYLRDANEIRKYISKFGMELDQLTEEEIELKREEELQELLLGGNSGFTGINKTEAKINPNRAEKEVLADTGKAAKRELL